MSPNVGFSGYNNMPSYHGSDVIYGAAAAAGVAPFRPPLTPPVAHQAQTHLLTPIGSVGTDGVQSVSEKMETTIGDGSKRISSISSLRLKAKGHINPQLPL